jgi:hypothetical protein
MPKDLFSFYEFEKIAVFTMPADAWLDIAFVYDQARSIIFIKLKVNREPDIIYELYYDYDYITPLLEAVTDILPVVGDYDKYFHTLRTYSRCIHDEKEGSDTYCWDFKHSRISKIEIIIRSNVDFEYEDELRYSQFEHDSDYNEPDTDKLTKDLMMAFNLPSNHFAYKLKAACDGLLKQVPLSKFEKEFGYPFPEKFYNRLKEYCNYHPYGFP